MLRANDVPAAVCHIQGQPLVVETVSVGPPGPGEVRVDIEVCAICHSDITFMSGGWGGATPAIYGHEAAGTVESVGAGVTWVTPGQKVVVGLMRICGECFHCLRGEDHLCVGEFPDHSPFLTTAGDPIVRGLATGAFSSQTVVHQSQVVPIPADIPLESACLLACGVLTGFGAVTKTAQIEPGSTVVVIGAGGVGISAIQGAVHSGASTVIAVDIVDSKLQSTLSFGATHTVNGSHGTAAETVAEITDGTGPDYVFVTVGVGVAIDQALGMIRRGGTVVLVGMPASGVMTPIEGAEFAGDSLRILGSKMGSAQMARDIPMLIDLYRRGGLLLDEMVSNVYPLEQINQAIAGVQAGTVRRNVISLR